VESHYHYDAQGSTLALTDDSQQVTDTYAYTAFGEATERTGNTENPFQYIGQKQYYASEAAGDILVRRRTYRPDIARWSSWDPLGLLVLKAGRPLYGYTRNRPTYAVDPSGLIELKRTDPSDMREKTLSASVCRTREELRESDDKTRVQRPFTSCKDEYCFALVNSAWESDVVRACRSTLGAYEDNSTADGMRCGDVAAKSPQCNVDCQYLAVYNPSTHSIDVCVDAIARELSPPSGGHEALMQSVLCHELLHARQSRVCRPSNNPFQTGDRCESSMRRELQAYACTSTCDWFWGCFERALRSSCPYSCGPPSQPTQGQIDELYKWANDFHSRGAFCPVEIRATRFR
jgi:RHS repeat-associated protein